MSGLDRLLRVLTSLSTPQDQTLGETAVDIAAGFVPGLGTAQALRDFERARREGDELGMALSGLGALPVVGGVPKVARKIFGGLRGASKAEREALERAKMLRAPTWSKTGWAETPDNSWMNEIDDSKAALKTVSGSNQIYLDHPELFTRYPQLKNYRVEVVDLPSNLRADHSPYGEIRINKSLPEDRRLNVLLHEFQHAVDYLEGRRPGTSASPLGDMDLLAAQLRSGIRAQNTADAAKKARTLMGRFNLSEQEAADFVAENSDQVLNYQLLDALVRNPDLIEKEREAADALVNQLRTGNVQLTAYENYLRDPGEVRARTTQYRQNLNRAQRRARDPIKDMEYSIDNPVSVGNQLRIYSPIF